MIYLKFGVHIFNNFKYPPFEAKKFVTIVIFTPLLKRFKLFSFFVKKLSIHPRRLIIRCAHVSPRLKTMLIYEKQVRRKANVVTVHPLIT